MRIILGMMTHNEGDKKLDQRYLRDVLNSTVPWVDDYVFIDNKSIDNTVDIIETFGRKLRQEMKVIKLDRNYFVIDESMPRNLLIKECLAIAKYDDWIFILDADEILCNGIVLRSALNTIDKNYEVFYSPVYDMWAKHSYRDDVLWQGHNFKYPIGFRKTFGTNYVEFNSKLHCGRIPANLLAADGFYNNEVAIKHLGWIRENDRIRKHQRYMQLDRKGQYGSIAQYESILDDSPNLELWDSKRFGC